MSPEKTITINEKSHVYTITVNLATESIELIVSLDLVTGNQCIQSLGELPDYAQIRFYLIYGKYLREYKTATQQ